LVGFSAISFGSASLKIRETLMTATASDGGSADNNVGEVLALAAVRVLCATPALEIPRINPNAMTNDLNTIFFTI
jgi:hypothetical protein